ncbi:hypothetical protein Patl1_27581 [Pistacia atlantica]|uniref:Uncharacterized protein n=1 Tax=Pistacia atlantica TaxID=434234 RepID=A0ACC1BGL0_9ROSI|nr:hypothetical protein Patl1_27581 [Pistacia atlantica]
MSKVILGLPGPWADDNREPSDHYTSKIGGNPDWPFYTESLNPNLLQCGACGSKLCLIAQVYAPVSSESLRIEERVVYVFGCVMLNCPKKSWWDSFDDDEDDDVDLEALGKALSEASSLASHSKKTNSNQNSKSSVKPSPLSQQKRVVDVDTPVAIVNLIGSLHQCIIMCPYTIGWTKGHLMLDASKFLSLYFFVQLCPAFTFIIMKCSLSKDVAPICSNYSSLSLKEKQTDVDDQVREERWEEERYEYDKALTVDRTYLKFKKQLDAYPEQCFRYSYGGKPLLATAEEGNPGKCKLCGGSRHFEMQLMSPLIYFLQEATDDCQSYSLENWNWMTLVVYTCSKVNLQHFGIESGYLFLVFGHKLFKLLYWTVYLTLGFWLPLKMAFSCSNSVDQEKSNNGGWIVTEEAVVVQFEKSLNQSAQLNYFS